MPEKYPVEPDAGTLQLQTPVIDVNEKTASSALELDIRDDDGDLEGAIAAIERLERAMRFPS
jgi:hypothetical protein